MVAELQQVIEYLDAHLTDDLSFVALAGMAGYSPWHFYHIFANCTGMPVMAYIRARRLQRAVEEMGHGRKLIDIAMDYGFETQAGFYKAFHRQFGCSPSRYRLHRRRQIVPQVDPVLLKIAGEGDRMQYRMVIRVVCEDDAESLWENIFSRNTLNEVKERISGNLRASAAGQMTHLVAEVDGHIVGNMLVTFDAHPLHAHRCSLYDVVVNPAFQRMGIARRLLEACQQQAVEKGKSLIIVNTRGDTTAETVYRKLGFIEYGRLPNGFVEQPPFWDNRCAYDEVLFYLPLTENQ
ncbi:MAG TPA: GNAT family N-acetyltransferase [Armatimonadota bacterium]|jgi:AraC-like DNA-binding protein/ribosomal protein S18 acetylase RimI-like enzyme